MEQREFGRHRRHAFSLVREELCEERDSTGGNTTKRFFEQGEQQGTDILIYTRDHLGSVRELLDTSLTIRARYDYDPYGRQTKISGDKDTAFGFTGHFTHAQSALVLAPYRAYDPHLGRWISQDPIDIHGGTNLYSYAYNDPAFYFDPDGLTPEGTVIGAGIGAAIGWWGGFALGGISGAAVAPGVGTIGGGFEERRPDQSEVLPSEACLELCSGM